MNAFLLISLYNLHEALLLYCIGVGSRTELALRQVLHFNKHPIKIILVIRLLSNSIMW